jgi:hypothetical protein
MHLAPTVPRPAGLAASGLLLGSIAAGRVVVRRLLNGSLGAGEVLQHRMLGTEAHYRVLGAADETVEVEVLDAPGLTPGMHLRLSAASARAQVRG